MTHYTRTWDCLVCGGRQDTIDSPRVEVCETCARRLAATLCRETLKCSLGPGIDEGYFMTRAYDYAEVLFGRRANAKRRALAREKKPGIVVRQDDDVREDDLAAPLPAGEDRSPA